MKAGKLRADQGDQLEWILISVVSSNGEEEEGEDSWSKRGGKRKTERSKWFMTD